MKLTFHFQTNFYENKIFYIIFNYILTHLDMYKDFFNKIESH